MTREAFIARLRAGLWGLPPAKVAELVSDYDAHFAEAAAAGRGEAEVAHALGDPDRLARELRAEVGVQRWEEQRNPSAAAQAVFAVLGLGALDVFVLLTPVLMVIGLLVGFYCAALVLFAAGVFALVGGPFTHFPGGPVAAVFTGLGMIAGATSAGAILTLITIGFVNMLVWYGRLHYRLLKPAIDPQP